MTPKAQRSAIEEACGWYPTPHGAWTRDPAGIAGPHVFDTPDYLNDLNAMHEAELKALGLKYDQWTRELRAICERDRRCIESATASHRAEAFLRTLNLWDDTK